MPNQNKEQLIKFVDNDLKELYEILYNSTQSINRYRMEKLYAELMLDWNRLYMILENEENNNETSN